MAGGNRRLRSSLEYAVESALLEALVGSSVVAIWTIRHPNMLVRWARRGFGAVERLASGENNPSSNNSFAVNFLSGRRNSGLIPQIFENI